MSTYCLEREAERWGGEENNNNKEETHNCLPRAMRHVVMLEFFNENIFWQCLHFSYFCLLEHTTRVFVTFYFSPRSRVQKTIFLLVSLFLSVL
jgi:hypothetical protein